MKFSVLILDGPYNHTASDSAWNFIQAALKKGHEIRGVFFYSDGVLNASSYTDPPQDDRHVVNRFSELSRLGIDLVVCIAAAKRRGITEQNLAPGFRISGLGQLVEMCITSDRLITFGG